MKKLLILMAAAALIVACSKDDNHGKLDPNAMISLRCAKNITPNNRATEDGHLTAREIVEQAWNLSYTGKDAAGESFNHIEYSFIESDRDLVNNRLFMPGVAIISADGSWQPMFIESKNIVVERMLTIYGDPITDWEKDAMIAGNRDTIAYISNATLRSACVTIRAAYDRGDYDTVYKLFDEAFTYVPITGAEWRELEAKGQN